MIPAMEVTAVDKGKRFLAEIQFGLNCVEITKSVNAEVKLSP
jgi:hypothetical protein